LDLTLKFAHTSAAYEQTHYQLLRTQGHMISYSGTALTDFQYTATTMTELHRKKCDKKSSYQGEHEHGCFMGTCTM
jgi:hypothetical protein